MKLFKRSEKNLPTRRLTERQPSAPVDDSYAFKRGRTLTGSISSVVRTANESGADLKSSRVHAHELRKKRRHISAIFLTSLAVTGGLYLLVSQFTADVVVRASPDPSLQLEPVYVEAIDEYLSDNLSQRWRMFTDMDKLTAYMQRATPEVESDSLRGSAGFGKSLFEITFREPIASWTVNSRELYVDETGVPFSRIYLASPIFSIIDESGMVSTGSGQSVMSNRFMSYVGQVIGLVEDQGYTVSTIVIPEGYDSSD